MFDMDGQGHLNKLIMVIITLFKDMELKSQEYMFFITGGLSTLAEALLECSAILVPLWMAVLVGLFLGWILGLRSRPRAPVVGTGPPSGTYFQMLKRFLVPWRQSHIKTEHDASQERAVTVTLQELNGANLARSAIQNEDLREFYQKLHYKDGGPPWEFLMEHSIPGMAYQAWRRDPQEGPTEYRSHHVFESATPQIVRDFFWDDEFRREWDDLIKSANCFEACTETGESVSHWIKKFPFFCSNREYVISRRIYECEGTYFCITKAVSHSEVPIKKKPRRVNVYSSCWCIQAVESSQTGQMTACEVIFLHSEDMLIQKDLAKLGVRRGMWPLVKRMEPGLRKYEAHRKSSGALSVSASMAQLVTNVPASFFEDSNTSEVAAHVEANEELVRKGQHANGWKWVLVGGVVVLACGLNGGAVGRVVVFGIAKRLSKLGRRP
eukprot:c19271_g1_i1 orf=257-1570(-)